MHTEDDGGGFGETVHPTPLWQTCYALLLADTTWVFEYRLRDVPLVLQRHARHVRTYTGL